MKAALAAQPEALLAVAGQGMNAPGRQLLGGPLPGQLAAGVAVETSVGGQPGVASRVVVQGRDTLAGRDGLCVGEAGADLLAACAQRRADGDLDPDHAVAI